MLRLPLQWHDKALDVVGVYLDAQDHNTSRDIVTSVVARLAQEAPADGLILAGDFNFVHDSTLDRKTKVLRSDC